MELGLHAVKNDASAIERHTCPEVDGKLSIGFNENVITSYFCIHNEHCDLGPCDPKICSIH